MNCANCNSPVPEDSRFCLQCGADLSDPGSGPATVEKPEELGTRLTQTLEGRYKVGKMVGRGGMGAVFLAEDLTLERPVAIKVLPPEVSHDEKLVGRFEREARTAAKLDHPNIIPIFAVESAGDLHYFVMKFVSGESLEQVLAAGPLTIEHCQEYLWEAARALGHAHKRQVVHRDIKPGNIMLEHDGRVMLADFGISKAMRSATQYTGTGQVIGTPFYMSPEQAKGQAVDGRSDQYSLAVVGFQMLTGQMPFTDEAVHTIIYKHIFEEPPSIRELRPDCPAYVGEVIHKALAKEPDHRFASMEDFAAALMPQRHVSSSPGVPAGTGGQVSPDAPTTITPTTGPTIVTSRKEPKKRRRGVGAALVSALVVVGGGTGYWAWQGGYLEQLEFLPSPDASTVAPGQQPDSATAADSISAVAAAAALAARDSAQRDSIARLTARNEELAADQDRAARQRTPPRQTRPQPVPQPQYGAITVDVVGDFGTVYIDGVKISTTPILRHRVTAGRHVIQISKQGCRNQIDTVMVAVGETVVRRVPLDCGG